MKRLFWLYAGTFFFRIILFIRNLQTGYMKQLPTTKHRPKIKLLGNIELFLSRNIKDLIHHGRRTSGFIACTE